MNKFMRRVNDSLPGNLFTSRGKIDENISALCPGTEPKNSWKTDNHYNITKYFTMEQVKLKHTWLNLVLITSVSNAQYSRSPVPPVSLCMVSVTHSQLCLKY